MDDLVRRAITAPDRVWNRAEVLARPCPVPPVAGIYGWYFKELPCRTDTSGCLHFGDLTLLYVGISPKAPPTNGARPSRQTIRNRIRYHFRSTAYGSTLRLTLGTELGMPLRLGGSGGLTFGEGEARLSAWMSENAFVTWVVCPEPWVAEHEFISELDLPLNLDGNRRHPHWPELSRLRRESKAAARGLGT